MQVTEHTVFNMYCYNEYITDCYSTNKNTTLYRCTVVFSVFLLSALRKLFFLENEMDVTKVTVALLYKGAIVRCVRALFLHPQFYFFLRAMNHDEEETYG